MDASNEAPSSDWVEISRLLARYPGEVDGRNVKGVMSCFASDAHLSFNGGAAVANGETEMVAFWQRLFGGTVLGEASTHLLSNYVIDIDGDRATATSQGVAFILSDGQVRVRGITYDDVLIRTPAGWRLSSRKHNAQWQFDTPASVVPAKR